MDSDTLLGFVGVGVEALEFEVLSEPFEGRELVDEGETEGNVVDGFDLGGCGSAWDAEKQFWFFLDQSIVVIRRQKVKKKILAFSLNTYSTILTDISPYIFSLS
jgi:hypothetical protein